MGTGQRKGSTKSNEGVVKGVTAASRSGKMNQPKSSIIGSLSRDVFERRTSTGSELFSLLVCLDANKFVLLSFFSPLKTIYSRVSTKPLPNDAKSSLPVDVRRSKTLLLKLPNICFHRLVPSRYLCVFWDERRLGIRLRRPRGIIIPFP